MSGQLMTESIQLTGGIWEQNKTFKDNVIKDESKYYNTYLSLILRTYIRIFNLLVEEIMASCDDSNILQDKGHNYFIRNEGLAEDYINLFYRMREYKQFKLGVNEDVAERTVEKTITIGKIGTINLMIFSFLSIVIL